MNTTSLLGFSALFCATAVYAQPMKTIDPADIANIKRVSTPQISPDGKLVAYVVETPVAAGTHRDEHIWMVSTDGSEKPRPFVLSDGADSSPRWSPDGMSIAFLSDRKNPITQPGRAPFPFSLTGVEGRTDLEPPEAGAPASTQLWLISAHGGEAVPLTNIAGGIKSFKWSRDGKKIAFVRKDQDTKTERERKKAKNDEITVDQNYKFDRLWILDVDQHQAHLLTKTEMNIDAGGIDAVLDAQRLTGSGAPFQFFA